MRTVLSFLKKLKNNNNRDWFIANKEEYNTAREEFTELISLVINGFGKYDTSIKELTAGNTIFRIYRDVRFSKDKTPYKANFAASLQKGGKKTGYAGYYIHIEPGNSFVGGGIWQPDAETTKKIRQEIDYNQEEFLSIINNRSFAKHYGDLHTHDFSLKRIPKGYSPQHPLEKYLRLNSWLAEVAYNDKEVVAKNFPEKIINGLKALKPFIDFLNKAM